MELPHTLLRGLPNRCSLLHPDDVHTMFCVRDVVLTELDEKWVCPFRKRRVHNPFSAILQEDLLQLFLNISSPRNTAVMSGTWRGQGTRNYDSNRRENQHVAHEVIILPAVVKRILY